MQRPRTVWFKLLAVVGGLVLALALAEAAIRIVEGQAPRPEQVTVHPVATDSLTNPLGLRDRVDALPEDPDLLRIAFLGDSFTYGLGVQAGQAFVRRTGVLLRERKTRWTITVNLGRPGVDLITAWTILNQVADTVRPDVVVHVLSQDDLDVDLYQEGQAIERLVSERSWLSRYSRLFDRAETAIRWSMATPRIVDHMQGGATPQQRERAWRIADHQIRAIRDLVVARGGAYVLVRFPCLRWVDGGKPYPLEETHDKTAKLAEQLGVPYLDLLETFRGRDPAEMCLSTSDDHPTPAAHQIAAEAIADFLVRAVLPMAQTKPATRPAKPRSAQEVVAAEISQYEQILQLDPTCASARFWLDKARNRPRRP